MQPATEYKEWLFERIRFALAQMQIKQPLQLAILLTSILDK